MQGKHKGITEKSSFSQKDNLRSEHKPLDCFVSTTHDSYYFRVVLDHKLCMSTSFCATRASCFKPASVNVGFNFDCDVLVVTMPSWAPPIRMWFPCLSRLEMNGLFGMNFSVLWSPYGMYTVCSLGLAPRL